LRRLMAPAPHGVAESDMSSAASSARHLRGFDLNGECAAVAHHDNWEDEVTGEPLWNYKIKVFPWTVFGVISIRIKPATVVVNDVWAASILTNDVQGDERVLTVELGHKSQDDYSFAMDGTGGPIRAAKLSCSNTEKPVSECGLEPTFTILNNYDGIMSPKVALATWQVGATVELTFHSRMSVGQAWGAELISDDVDADDGHGLADQQTLRFRLMPLARGLPPERKDSFGFEATPPFHEMPTIACDLRRALPPPPPPSPPKPSPPPPERKLVDTSQPPSHVGVPWRFDVTLVQWVPDVLLTLNFAGDAHDLQGHPLQIDSIEPAAAVWQDAITKHSVTYRLRPVVGGDPGALHIVAFGMVTGLGQVTCCCGPPPPPPPLPPPSPTPRPPPSPWPKPPPPPPFSHMQNMAFHGVEQHDTSGIMGSATEPTLPTSTASDVTSVVWISVFAFLALVYYGRKSLKQLREHLLFHRLKRDIAMRIGSESSLDPDMDHSIEVNSSTDGITDATESGSSRSRRSKRTMLCMLLPGGASEEVRIDLSGVETLRQLQGMVLEEWVQAGGDRKESLMMEHVDSKGRATKVSKVTTLAVLQASPTLNLLPKSHRKQPESADGSRYGRLRQSDPAQHQTSAQTLKHLRLLDNDME